MKKIPLRTCVVTKEKLPKKELIRIVRTKDDVVIDKTGKINGRGTYLKIDKEVFERAKKSNILERHLETKVQDKIYDELEELLK